MFHFYQRSWTPLLGTTGRFTYLYFITAWLKEVEGGATGATTAEKNEAAAGRQQGHFIARHAGLLSLVCYAALVFEACFSRWRVTNGLGAFTLYIGDWLTLLFEFSLFYLFKKLCLKESRFINVLAGPVFGVYLLHENFLWMSWKDHERFSILWDQLLKAGNWYYRSLFPVYYILVTLLVFAACAAVEFVFAWLRRQFLSRCLWLNALCDRIDRWYMGMYMDGE